LQRFFFGDIAKLMRISGDPAPIIDVFAEWLLG